MEFSIAYVEKLPEGYDLYYSPDFDNPIGAFNYGGKPCIVYGNIFVKYSDIYMEAILQHEIGHIVLEHIWNKPRDISIEMEADVYSALVVGIENMIGALEFTKTLYPESPNLWELDLRILHLKEIA